MATYHDPDQADLDRAEEWQALEFAAEQDQKKRDHEYRIDKLKLSTQTRHKAIRDILIALIKAPAWFVLAFFLPGLLKLNIEIPKFLQDFLAL